jgi:RES domain-containing protein
VPLVFDRRVYVCLASDDDPEQLLLAPQSLCLPGRWNPGRIAALYAATEPDTALDEQECGFAEAFGCAPGRELRMAIFHAHLRFWWDLTDPRVRRRLGVYPRHLAGSGWRQMSTDARTQLAGRTARDLGVEGMLVPSAAARRGHLLVFFPENRRPESEFRLVRTVRIRVPRMTPESTPP